LKTASRELKGTFPELLEYRRASRDLRRELLSPIADIGARPEIKRAVTAIADFSMTRRVSLPVIISSPSSAAALPLILPAEKPADYYGNAAAAPRDRHLVLRKLRGRREVRKIKDRKIESRRFNRKTRRISTKEETEKIT